MYKNRLLGAALASCMLMAQAPAYAEDFPTKPITIVVPFGAGGNSDGFARLMQQAIQQDKLMDQPLVIINVPGAGGSVGARRVHGADPDGHTILLTHLSLLTAQAAGTIDFGYEDFEPIAGTGDACMVTAVMDDAPWKTLDELLKAAAAEPDTIVHGANIGGVNHIAGLALQDAGDAEFRFAQIGGGTANFEALLGRHTQVAQFAMAEWTNFRAGGVAGLAYLGAERHPSVPEMPTAKELGYDVQLCLQSWWFAPAGTPREAVDYLADVFERAMQNEAMKTAMTERMLTLSYAGPDEMKEILASEFEQVAPLVALTKSK